MDGYSPVAMILYPIKTGKVHTEVSLKRQQIALGHYRNTYSQESQRKEEYGDNR